MSTFFKSKGFLAICAVLVGLALILTISSFTQSQPGLFPEGSSASEEMSDIEKAVAQYGDGLNKAANALHAPARESMRKEFSDSVQSLMQRALATVGDAHGENGTPEFFQGNSGESSQEKYERIWSTDFTEDAE